MKTNKWFKIVDKGIYTFWGFIPKKGAAFCNVTKNGKPPIIQKGYYSQADLARAKNLPISIFETKGVR